ncbi:MAG: DUF2325 domain-containing protein [Desulfovibrionaceae bacterium]
MGAALIGGMDRLHRDYREAAHEAGVRLKTYTGKEHGLGGRIGPSTAFVVLMTAQISHSARREVLAAAKANGIPVYLLRSSGVSTLRECLNAVARPA